MDRWIKKLPYKGWLIVVLFMLLASVIVYQSERRGYSKKELTAAVQKSFSASESEIRQHLDRNIYSDLLSENDSSRFQASYFLFITRVDEVLFWNTRLIDLPPEIIASPNWYLSGRIATLNQGTFYIRSFPLKKVNDTLHENVYAFTLIPLLYKYSVENQYFRSYFAASERIPLSTQIVEGVKTGAQPVLDNPGRRVFYLDFKGDPRDNYHAGVWVWIFSILALFAFFAWVHEFCLVCGRHTKPIVGWLVLVIIRYAISVSFDRFGVPDGFANSRLFSPELLASGDVIHSLGDFMLTIILDAWVLIYLLMYIPLEHSHSLSTRGRDRVLWLLLGCFVILILYYGQANNMYRLVIDSKISFEVNDFSNLSSYTFIGIFVLSVITLNIILLLGVFNAIMGWILPRRNILKYFVLLICSTVCIYLLFSKGELFFYLAVLVMSIAGLILLDVLGLPFKSNDVQVDLYTSPRVYIWFAILCSWVTLEIFYFNHTRERDIRVVFAQKQVKEDEAFMSYAFDEIARGIGTDTFTHAVFHNAHPDIKSSTNKYLFLTYLSDFSKKYSINTYFYDRNQKPVLAVDTIDRALMQAANSISAGKQQFGLFNIEGKGKNNSMFWAYAPVWDSAGRDTIGYIGLDISIDKRPKTAGAKSFLGKRYNPTDQYYYDKYSFGIYKNNTLWAQGGRNVFPYRIRQLRDTANIRFRGNLYESTLTYRTPGQEVIKIIYQRNLLANIASLFGYVLAVLLVVTTVILSVRQLVFHPDKVRYLFRNFNFTIRSKVNLTILITVFASLFLVGFITLSFLNNKYKDSQRRSLQALLLYYSQNILHFTEDNGLEVSAGINTSLHAYADLSFRLKALSEELGAEVNLYNADAQLIATSQLELLQKGFLSSFMQRQAYLTLRSGVSAEVTMTEQLGELKYPSIYAPIRDKYDRIFAYVNIPYYAAKEELNEEVSGVLVALINVYTLIFIISGISAILVSNSIIRAFKLLIHQFRAIRLRHNELIQWPYKDEIGLLVKEYNIMMQKVESMATQLAQKEREDAWRDIAKQVAHEIKNPLTPMKLNIQYLQQSIKMNRPGITDLAARVSATLIEQIENLNLIATEFSNYAKMPVASPEAIDLGPALTSIMALFQKSTSCKITLQAVSANIYVFMDKGHFIRIFNNIIQNALQAIPEARQGAIGITYQQKGKSVVIVVRDNGIGVPVDLKDKLFVPYFTTKSSGSGLGLPMTRNMILQAQGRIWFESKPGEGAVFYVALPVYST